MEQKKSLGQNFFINKNLSEQIINLVRQEEPEVIVEIGPGKGAFTNLLVQSEAKIVLVEKDDTLAQELAVLNPNVDVHNADFLEWNMEELEKYADKKIVFFGSLPYNVSKPIIRKIVESKYFKNNSYFIIQKEVAEKYIAKVPENNLLSVQTQLYATSKRILDISPDSFKPRPKVNSSLILFSPKEPLTDFNHVGFGKFVKKCFIQPRKTLKNNLKGTVLKDDPEVNGLLLKRAQHLSLEEYLFLFGNVENLLI